MSTENLKKRHGDKKLPFSVIPVSALRVQAQVHNNGAEKYGELNWRKDPVDTRTYYNAAMRHLTDWWDGIDTDPDSGFHSLGHVIACCNILIDSEARGILIDDRGKCETVHPHPANAFDNARQWVDLYAPEMVSGDPNIVIEPKAEAASPIGGLLETIAERDATIQQLRNDMQIPAELIGVDLVATFDGQQAEIKALKAEVAELRPTKCAMCGQLTIDPCKNGEQYIDCPNRVNADE